jgi:predicted naringenin-chalcone synthase
MHNKFLSLVPRLVPDERQRRLFQRLISKSHINTRFSVLEPSPSADRIDNEDIYVFGRFPSTEQRMAIFERESKKLVAQTVTELLLRLRMDRERISHLVLTTCTGFFAPGLDIFLQKELGLRSDIERTIIGFMGCNAAFNALKSAANIVGSDPDAKVVVVNIELCSLHFQDLPSLNDEYLNTNADFERLMSYLQFADGCAAALVSAEPGAMEIIGFHSEIIPDLDDLIQWRVGDSGFQMRLALNVPARLGQSLGAALSGLVPREKWREIDLWAIHPGGRAILDVVQDKLELSEHLMEPSRNVLRRFGNMSSATVMYVLKEILDQSQMSGNGVAMGFGPGLTLESMQFIKYA